MRSNIDRRATKLEQHEDVERADLDYDDGEVVLVALCEKFDDDVESFLESLDLDIVSGPKFVGFGVEVIVG